MSNCVHKSKCSRGAVSIVHTTVRGDVGNMHEPSVPIACVVPPASSTVCGTFLSGCHCSAARLNVCLTDD